MATSSAKRARMDPTERDCENLMMLKKKYIDPTMQLSK